MKKLKIQRIQQSIKYFNLFIKIMLSYCLKCRKNTESKNPRVAKTSKRNPMLLSKCAMCGIKKVEIY